jgi:dihydrofolate reductase
MQISIIAAIAQNLVIGVDNHLPWHLPADLKHYKALTLGKPIIMGRKTFESMGKALPNRRNIVISHQKDLSYPDCEVYTSLVEAISKLANYPEIMIIGGSNIYREALLIADKMYLTIIHHNFVGDAYFPKWNKSEWQETLSKDFAASEKFPYAYSFVTLVRKN